MVKLGQVDIREAREADAPAMLDFMLELTLEPDLPILMTHERAREITLEEERGFIRGHLVPANSTLLLAQADQRIIGILNLTGGAAPENAHAVSLGMSVARGWRDRGVGRALVTHALAWARETAGISRVELEVFPHNARAIHLYRHVGFEVEGRRRKAYIKDGVALDVVLMAVLLDEAG